MGINLTAIGLSGIDAAEAELQATSSNIANVNNPNYSLESAQLAVQPGPNDGGAGVQVTGIQRAEAPFLTSAIGQTQASQSYFQAYSQVGQVAQGYLAPSSGSDLATAMQNMFDSFNNLTASPSDTLTRSTAINSAGQFAATAQALLTQLDQTASGEGSGLGALLKQVNTDTGQLAQLNVQIQRARAGGLDASALLDQRDAVSSNLAGLIGATTDANGNVSVAGLPLVRGATALPLSTGGGATASVQVDLADGSFQIAPSQLGGQIGGLLAGIGEVQQLRSQLGGLVTSVANAVNTQYGAGYGLDGSTGNALFTVASDGSVTLNSSVTAQNFAAAQSAAGLPGDGSNAAALAAIANSTSSVDSSFPGSTAGQALAQITTAFGSALQNANDSQQNAAASAQSLSQLKGSITGVSLNDQLTHLIQYQNALQASGRAVQVTNDLVTFLTEVLT